MTDQALPTVHDDLELSKSVLLGFSIAEDSAFIARRARRHNRAITTPINLNDDTHEVTSFCQNNDFARDIADRVVESINRGVLGTSSTVVEAESIVFLTQADMTEAILRFEGISQNEDFSWIVPFDKSVMSRIATYAQGAFNATNSEAELRRFSLLSGTEMFSIMCYPRMSFDEKQMLLKESVAFALALITLGGTRSLDRAVKSTVTVIERSAARALRGFDKVS